MKKKFSLAAILAVFVALGWYSREKYCAQSPNEPMCVAPTPAPSPSATPTPGPTPTATPEPQPTPSPTPAATPTPLPTPTPTPGGTACPKPLAEGAHWYLNNKRYGNGIDSTLRVAGDPEFCRLIHGVSVNDCHLEGWPRRTACELEIMGGCPVWQYTMDGGSTIKPLRQAPHPEMSADHFGDPVYRDDPQTPDVFEGRPAECGLQRDEAGDPKAGFFCIVHGLGEARACLPNETACGPWILGKDN